MNVLKLRSQMLKFDAQVDLEQLAIPSLKAVFTESSKAHKHLCPRQILGARIGLAGAKALMMDVPRNDKKMLVIVETDGCFVSGVQAATGCAVNRRTLRVEDIGKIAATLINIKTEEAIRIAPQTDVREKAWHYAPKEASKRYYAMLHGYQLMPDSELLTLEPVKLERAVGSIISKAGMRVNCESCLEEIINEREVMRNGKVLCRSCAGEAYYRAVKSNE